MDMKVKSKGLLLCLSVTQDLACRRRLSRADD